MLVSILPDLPQLRVCPSGLHQWMHGDNFCGKGKEFAREPVGVLLARVLLRPSLGHKFVYMLHTYYIL